MLVLAVYGAEKSPRPLVLLRHACGPRMMSWCAAFIRVTDHKCKTEDCARPPQVSGDPPVLRIAIRGAPALWRPGRSGRRDMPGAWAGRPLSHWSSRKCRPSSWAWKGPSDTVRSPGRGG